LQPRLHWTTAPLSADRIHYFIPPLQAYLGPRLVRPDRHLMNLREIKELEEDSGSLSRILMAIELEFLLMEMMSFVNHP